MTRILLDTTETALDKKQRHAYHNDYDGAGHFDFERELRVRGQLLIVGGTDFRNLVSLPAPPQAEGQRSL
jgi:hypothetical protein